MNILEYMKERVLILDGGMGTLLQKAGLPAGEHPESWNITHPDIVTGIHRDYYDAGSNVVAANTFGASSLKFSDAELEEIIRCALENARKAKETSSSNTEKFIALDIGSLGKMLKPYGELDFEDAVSVFSKTVKLGVKYGADLIFIETMNDSYETKAALLAAKENSSLPVFVSNAYSEDGKLMTGATPEAMVAMLEGMGADAIGLNCSFGPEKLMPVAMKILEKASVPVIFKPNAGIPESKDGKTVFNVMPEEFSDYIKKSVEAGIRAVGGCCGTTPEYIKLVSEKIQGISPAPIVKKSITCVSSYTHSVEFSDKSILIGERINPTGKARFKQALREHDIAYILKEGINQKEKGSHILDVNVGLPEIDEKQMMKDCISELQAVIDLPLQIDTSDFVAMEQALRLYNGKAMINSVNGKKENMDKVFPLVRKYGGVTVALTLDENGIPETSDGRLKIAEKILNEAEKYGIEKKDIIFDPLAMAVSADSEAAKVTLESVKKIHDILGCKTVLGVSNISFGLPERNAVNSTFFAMALQNGLSAAIMNPYSEEMMKTYYSFNALKGIDGNFSEYISFASGLDTVKTPPSEKSDESLRSCIIKGLKEAAAKKTKALISENEPLDIVKNEIIPALDKVGTDFENKTVYLPQLLMSAEAAKSAFEVIKASCINSKKETGTTMTVILATVHGDIHDIGKNIVRLLLENYGFNVIDLGKDVPKETIIQKVLEEKAPLLGLSALMTTTVPAMEETIKLLRQEAPWCKVIVGGAVLTEEYAEKIGADAYSKDAMETVRYACGLNGN